ncbi:putative Golgi apparatus protein 1 [Apostichopus japonicus]|uniref:Putative Golgi apparatus protein 1 n=1 Tax=Stichopus japonicus TaxID=307972 RepID=A0A2G8L372_STIJA|nr:putative Golgi apparatus protein 1 [Apostichopus japonicus]
MSQTKKNKNRDAAAAKACCSQAMEVYVLDLLEEVKAGSDYRLDPILASSCEKSRAILCSKVKSGDSKVLSCLMDNIESELMEEKCSSRLYELQYFISRDFKLDINLHRSCKHDADQYCSFQEGKMDGETFACLNLHLHNKKQPLSIDCASQVHRALRQRASSVSLNPSIEKKCRTDLGRYCPSSVKEFSCLQDHYTSLESECRMAIKNFTREESEDVRMNKVLMKACSPMLKRYCQDSLKKKVDEGDALDCLIRRKNDADMDPKCAAGIEHFQIIQLDPAERLHPFIQVKKACKEDVQKLCSKKDTKKDTILTCLSKFIRTDTLLGYRQNVSESCRAQVKFEMLQESESIKLDPVLGDYCKADLDKFCALRTKDDGASLECLRKYSDQLSPKCYKALFNKTRELEDKPEWDYFLMKVCQSFIKTTCKSSPETLMDCLQNHVHDELMGEKYVLKFKLFDFVID